MKNKKRIWKFIGGAIGLAAIACIIPSCIVSCGSAANSASTNQSSSSTNGSNSNNLNKDTNWKEIDKDNEISNKDYQSIFDKYQTQWDNYIKNDNDYKNLVTTDIKNYCDNISTYFDNFCNTYNNLTGANYLFSLPTIDSNWITINTTFSGSTSNQSQAQSMQDQIFSQIISLTYSNLVINATNHTFNVTFNYEVRNSDSQNFIHNNVTDGSIAYENATISPTLLCNWNNVLSLQSTNVIGGWYLSSAASIKATTNTIVNPTYYNNPSQTNLAAVMFCWQGQALSKVWGQNNLAGILGGNSWAKYLNDNFAMAGFDYASSGKNQLTNYYGVNNANYDNKNNYTQVLNYKISGVWTVTPISNSSNFVLPDSYERK